VSDQLTLFCPQCCGALMIVAEVFDRHGEKVLVPQPCPSCRPRPASQEAWRAACAVAKRLVAGGQR
jgi:hypothetical protein